MSSTYCSLTLNLKQSSPVSTILYQSPLIHNTGTIPFSSFPLDLRNLHCQWFLVRDAFVTTNRRATATMFARLSVWLSVRLPGTRVHCDHTVHINGDLSLWLDSPMFWTLWHQSMSVYSRPSFSSSTWKRGGVWMCKLSKEFNANNDK